MIPKESQHAQNYSNPFNPSTNIIWQSLISCWQVFRVLDDLAIRLQYLLMNTNPQENMKLNFPPAICPAELIFMNYEQAILLV
ncbi:MAG: hypothetical protein A2W11_10185 [Ignavibacteria bacterium RBG_16_35_7]|nr:MAG: hypothetical protein A2W11_10185 [Ignavibacteria bacterium RBG_16_35_7]